MQSSLAYMRRTSANVLTKLLKSFGKKKRSSNSNRNEKLTFLGLDLKGGGGKGGLGGLLGSVSSTVFGTIGVFDSVRTTLSYG